MLHAYLRLLRPADWTKNVLVFCALVFASELTRWPSIWRSCVAFVAFVLLSAGFYAINDALDVTEDRTHPVKRRRPVAAGEIAPAAALRFGLALIAIGIVLGFLIAPLLGLTCVLYVLLQVAYNVRLKRVMMVDVTAVAIGFVLRAAAGAAAIHKPLSVWLAMCVFFLCLYLGFIKRLCDLSSAERAAKEAGETAGGTWHSVAGYESRSELDWLLAVSGMLTVMTYLMYTLSPHAFDLFRERTIGLALLTPLVVIAIHRFYRRASLGWSDRPMEAIVRDRAVRACVVLFAAGLLLSIYLPGFDRYLKDLFVK